MTERILGPEGSTRRRRFLWAPMLLIACVALFAIGSAQAVFKTGALELDGDATSLTAPSGEPQTNDWDRVCHQATSSSACGTTSDTASPKATAVSWSGDCLTGTSGTFGCGDLTATTFTGGGSKDPQDISSWAWNDGGGGLPAKDNLEHGFAARFSVSGTTNVGTCPNGTDLNGGTFDPSVNCELLYFGSDRFDNSGDAQQGFWFFQNPIGLGTNSVGGGTGFTGVHKNGDVLVISDFSVGGTTSTITVYKWDSSCAKGATKPNPGDCGDANLRLLATSTSAKCDPGLSQNVGFCGIVNTSDTTPVPWRTDYLDKSGNSSTYLAGELYEGGINLSLLGLGSECFSSIGAETRASTSTTATLKDFVLGTFAQCGATMGTTPHGDQTVIGTGGTASVSDDATITVTGGSSPPAPTGTVSFWLCGPSQTAITSCAPSGTATATAALPGSKSGNAYTVSSGSVTVHSAGYYCWYSSWPGDGNYKPVSPATTFNHDGSDECLQILPIQPTIVTTQTAGPLALGSSISDTATLGNTAKQPDGSAAGGTITFTAYGPQADPAHPDCTGTAVYTSAAYPVSGNNTYPTAAQAAASFQPSQAGQYNWVATYSGNSPNTKAVASNCADEASVIISLQPTMDTAQSFYPNDQATLGVGSGAAGNIKGSVRFRLYTTIDCSGTAIVDQTVSGIDHASPVTVNTTNTTVAVSTTQHNLSWKVEFVSTNSGIKNVTSSCHNENSDLAIDNGSQSNTP